MEGIEIWREAPGEAEAFSLTGEAGLRSCRFSRRLEGKLAWRFS